MHRPNELAGHDRRPGANASARDFGRSRDVPLDSSRYQVPVRGIRLNWVVVL